MRILFSTSSNFGSVDPLFLDTCDPPEQYSASSVAEPEETAVDVASWLRNLGLERYEAAFRENDVSAEVLCDLTAEDLEGLGVATIGHRRRLLVAIAQLRDGALQAVRPTDDHLASPSTGEPVIWWVRRR